MVKNQGTKQRVQRIFGDCWQWKTNGQCVKGDSCSFRHDMNKRGKITPSNPSPNSFMRQNEPRTRSPRGRSPSGGMSRWPCKDYLEGTCNNSFCENGTLQNACSTRPRVVAGLVRSAHSHSQVDEQPTKRFEKNDNKSAAATLKKGDWQKNLVLTNVTIDRGNLGKEVIKNWDKIHLFVSFLMHDNWVAYFRTGSRRSLFSGKAPTCRDQSNV